MIDDLKMIRKYYGEGMMHLCRELFSTLLETPGLLYSLLESKFAPNHYLYEDIKKYSLMNRFKDYIYSLIDNSLELVKTDKTPFELMEEAGYTLYECHNEDDIQGFRKYYQVNEELCTFYGRRLNNCYVFFAVKKNVDQIKRKDFLYPERQDEYGTSVISIQFTRGERNTLSIKNRYNHRVNNPDATFSNNLDNIIPGLTDSFMRTYGLNIEYDGPDNFEIDGYVKANDGKYYKYNYEINNVYYCPGNIIIDNLEVKRDYQEMEKYIITDYFIIDLVNKEVRLYDSFIGDSFIDGLHDIKKIEVVRNRENGNKTITIIPSEGSEIVIEIDKYNRIVGYKNNNLKEVGDNFLIHNKMLFNVELLNLEIVGNRFLKENLGLINLSLPALRKVGDEFLKFNESLSKLDVPNLIEAGNYFLDSNIMLERIDLPKVIRLGNYALGSNQVLIDLNAPELISVGDCFLYCNNSLTGLQLPSLVTVGNHWLYKNNTLRTLDVPNLKIAGHSCLRSNTVIIDVNFSNLESVGMSFMSDSPIRFFLLNGIEERGLSK